MRPDPSFRAAFFGVLILMLPALVLAQDDPFRLGDSVAPTHQQITLRIDPESPSYSGHTTVQLAVRVATSSFRFHAQEMDIESLTLSSSSATVNTSFESGEADLTTVTTEQPLTPGDYVLEIAFANKFDTTSKSLYRTLHEGDGYLFTQFESDDARGAFPCWDEPAFKITWDVTLEIPEHQFVLFNTPERSSSSADGWKSVVYETTPKLPSYLLALAAGPLEAVDIPGMDFPARVVCPKGQTAMAAEAVRITPSIVAALEAYFDSPYPFKKLDLVAVPEFWPGAMENPGAITFRDTILLLDNDAMTTNQKSVLASVNAHELAHMWFGNLVTMEWWDDLWLNESFATWLGEKVTTEVFPEYGRDISSVRSAIGAMSSDTQVVAKGIRRFVGAQDQKMTDASLTYAKGHAVLAMFEKFIGEDLFREGVRKYINDNARGNARADHLWSALGETAGLDVSTAMATFLDQPGVPRVSATVLGDGKIELSQSRFLNYGSVVDEEQSWKIPVVFKYDDGNEVRTHRVMLSEQNQIIELPGGQTPKWIHPNADEAGYYHWSVPAEMLLDMSEHAAERLGVRERVALVGHLSALLDAGDIDGSSYLEAIGHVAADPRAEVLQSIVSALGKVRVAFVTQDQRDLFARYVQVMLRPAVESYGLVPREGEPEAVSMFRPAMIRWLGIFGRDPEIIVFAKNAATQYMEDPTQLDASLAGPSLAIAAMSGDWKLYNKYKKHFEAAEVPADRTRYLSALGYFNNRGMAKAALDYAITDAVRPTEMFSLMRGVGTNFGEEGLVWDWFVANYDNMAQRLPEMFLSFMPFFASGCSAERLASAEIFFGEEAHSPTGTSDQLAKVGEGVNDCVSLRDREGEAVSRFLSQYAAQ